nr:MAG TPA: hypothetical protein [Caudoviricetes sp.]
MGIRNYHPWSSLLRTVRRLDNDKAKEDCYIR